MTLMTVMEEVLMDAMVLRLLISSGFCLIETGWLLERQRCYFPPGFVLS